MKIRCLIEPHGSNLEVFRQMDGDVVVKIEDTTGVHTVTIGLAGSGHQVPPSVKKALARVADEFAKYADCKWETDASNKEFDKNIRHLLTSRISD